MGDTDDDFALSMTALQVTEFILHHRDLPRSWYIWMRVDGFRAWMNIDAMFKYVDPS